MQIIVHAPRDTLGYKRLEAEEKPFVRSKVDGVTLEHGLNIILRGFVAADNVLSFVDILYFLWDFVFDDLLSEVEDHQNRLQLVTSTRFNDRPGISEDIFVQGGKHMESAID
jgi:hypothetical protein